VLDEPVVFKDQRAGRIKWSDIEVQIHTSLVEKIMGKLAILEMVVVTTTSYKDQ